MFVVEGRDQRRERGLYSREIVERVRLLALTRIPPVNLSTSDSSPRVGPYHSASFRAIAPSVTPEWASPERSSLSREGRISRARVEGDGDFARQLIGF